MRLQNYPYDKSGAYFITICTHNRQRLFGEVISNKETSENEFPTDYVVGADSISARIIAKTYYEMIENTEGYRSYGLVIMPDHIHMIVGIFRADIESAPTAIPNFIQSFKRNTTLKIIRSVRQGKLPPFENHLWQRGYFDHVIRNRDDLTECRRYIKNNPKKINP